LASGRGSGKVCATATVAAAITGAARVAAINALRMPISDRGLLNGASGVRRTGGSPNQRESVFVSLPLMAEMYRLKNGQPTAGCRRRRDGWEMCRGELGCT